MPTVQWVRSKSRDAGPIAPMSRTHMSQSPAADLPRRTNGIPKSATSAPISAQPSGARSTGSTPFGLMADGDQTGALVEGWYGDITLQAR